jgi:TatD DNase family protein
MVACWVDSHCHLCNPPLADRLQNEIDTAGRHNIGIFISTALNREEIDWHLDNTRPEIRFVAGIHPFYDKSTLKDFDYLVEQCRKEKLWGIGEIGYDKRKNNHNYQKNLLYQQLELAEECNLPVILHIVHRYNEIYHTLKNDFPNIRGYIHGFTGSVELVEMFSRFNIGFSIGNKLLAKKDFPRVIQRIIQRGLLLFETDAPFQQPGGNNAGQTGLLANLTSLINQVSKGCNLPAEDLLDLQWETMLMMKC